MPVKGGSFAEEFTSLGFKVYLVNIGGWKKLTLPAYDFYDSTVIVGLHLEAAQDLKEAINWIAKREKLKKSTYSSGPLRTLDKLLLYPVS